MYTTHIQPFFVYIVYVKCIQSAVSRVYRRKIILQKHKEEVKKLKNNDKNHLSKNIILCKGKMSKRMFYLKLLAIDKKCT